MRTIKAADLFCGAGGTSSGLERACKNLGYKLRLLAINHWDVAIATHSDNHPEAAHMCESLDNVNPRKAVPGGYLDLLVASPECTHHSNARGGRPMSDQSRASGWHILRWAEAIRIENILIENVREFESWGPLGADGRPLKSKRGQTFQAFLNALKALNYTVDYRVLNAANYGDPTTRERLFIMARRGRKQIVWPEPTHTPDGEATLFGKTQRWRAAREIIDWNILGQSIFERKRPLAANTLKRIETGLRKYCGKEIEPFLVILKGTSTVKKVNDPVPAVTTVPYVGLCEPFLVEFYGHGRAVSVEDPIPTATTRDRFGVCQPFIIGQQSCAAPRSVKDPVPTIATAGAIALVEPFIVGITQTGSGAGRTRSIDRPLPTVVTKEEFALCQPAINGKHLDIRFRMLRPHELARAMSFDDEYKFHGSRGEQVKQIGNAVPVMTAQRLCEALLQ